MGLSIKLVIVIAKFDLYKIISVYWSSQKVNSSKLRHYYLLHLPHGLASGYIIAGDTLRIFALASGGKTQSIRLF